MKELLNLHFQTNDTMFACESYFFFLLSGENIAYFTYRIVKFEIIRGILIVRFYEKQEIEFFKDNTER